MICPVCEKKALVCVQQKHSDDRKIITRTYWCKHCNITAETEEKLIHVTYHLKSEAPLYCK